MIAPKPFKYICKKCKYEKIVKPKSDVFPSVDMINICPKCKGSMQRKELSPLDNIKSVFS